MACHGTNKLMGLKELELITKPKKMSSCALTLRLDLLGVMMSPLTKS